MALIDWTDDLSVGVTEIDGQHRELVRLINELNDAMAVGKGKDALGPIISGLIDYAATHFATEEAYFDKFNYSFGGAHKLEHKSFTSKVSDFKAGFDEGRVLLSMEVMNFLKDWLVSHIQKVDKKYTPCFKENGLS